MKAIVRTRLVRAVQCALALMASNASLASSRDDALDVTFDVNMLSSPNSTADVSRFSRGNPVYPGVRDVFLAVNGRSVARAPVRFAAASADVDATPCIDAEMLSMLGVREDRLQSPTAVASRADACHDLIDWLPNASVELNDGEHRLDFSIAQADLRDSLPQIWGPDSWDRSVNGARLNYALNTYRTSSDGSDAYQRTSLQLDAGLNLGRWHLRHRSAQAWGSGARQSQVLGAYAQTAIPSIGADLTVGDFHTFGQVFDSIGLRGIRLQTDERMLADSQRGYAPVVRGTAQTNALVTIRQNGAVIRELSVPAGEFEIRDLHPTGFGGDLEVTVTEADGRQEQFSVPYASVVQLLREGATRFSMSAGRWEDGISRYAPWVTQLTWQRGWNNWLTSYVGAQYSQDLANVLFGSAVNTFLGAIALDGTFSRAHLPSGEGSHGHSVRLSYSNFLPATRTSLMVATQRYASEGFWSLSDLVSQYDAFDAGWASSGNRTRHRFDLQLEQPIGRGSLYASAIMRNFWDKPGEEQYMQVGYARTFKHFALSTAWRRTQSQVKEDSQLTLSLSVPLNRSARNANRLYSQSSYSREDGHRSQLSLYGSAGERHQWSYGATALGSSNDSVVRGGLNAAYQGAYANVAATYGLGDQKQTSLSVAGGLVAHPGGITAGQAMSDTIGIVHVPEGAGARLLSAVGVKVDKRGYAVVPSLSPYRANRVVLDSSTVSPDVQFTATAQDIVPRAGAIVPVSFEASRERSWLLRALLTQDQPLPLGAQIVDAQGAVLGVVDHSGYALIRGEPAAGMLSARWGKRANERCDLADGRPGTTSRMATMEHAETRCADNVEES